MERPRPAVNVKALLLRPNKTQEPVAEIPDVTMYDCDDIIRPRFLRRAAGAYSNTSCARTLLLIVSAKSIVALTLI